MGANNPTYYQVLGESELIQLPDERAWDEQNGVQTRRRFVGTAEKVRAKFNELSALGYSSGADGIDESFNGKKGELIIRVNDDSGGDSGGNTEELNAVWELFASDTPEPIQNHRDFDAITSARKSEIMKLIRKGDPLGTGATVAEKKLYAYLASGVKDFLHFTLTLRKTTTVSRRTTITASYAGINTIVAQTAEELNSVINPPTMIIGALTSLPKIGGDAGAWEWLKKGTQTRQIGRGKFQIVYEWQGYTRAADIYGGSWVPSAAD